MADSSSLPPALRSVCVYCGASNTTKPEYLDLATRFGAAMAARGLRLVYGGGAVGLMGRVAKAVHENGGDVLGIMPRFLERREITYEDVPHRMVDTMHERKHIMFEESDAFVVLPGGIGTLEEAVEVLSWHRLGLHAKPLAFLSEDGMWDALDAFLKHTIALQLTPTQFVNAYKNCSTIEEALSFIQAAALKGAPANIAQS